jgi:hypothetical protein
MISQDSPIFPNREGGAVVPLMEHFKATKKTSACSKECIGRLLAASLAFLPLSSFASETTATEPQEWNNSWSSPYSRALGGSQTAHAITEDAVFANPAGLARTRNPRSKKTVDVVEVPKMSIGGNTALVDGLKGKGLQPSSWLKNFGTAAAESRTYMEMQLFPWLVMGERRGPTYFLGLPIRSSLLALPSTDGGVSRRIETQTTAMAVFGAVLSNRSGTMSLGLSVRPNMRWNSRNTFSIVDIVSSKNLFTEVKKSFSKTTSTAIDLGFTATAGDFWLPTFGLSLLNLPTGCVDNYPNPATGKTQSICGAKRTGDVNDEIPGTKIDPTEIRAGLSITPRFKLGSQRINIKVSGDIYPLPIKSGDKNYGFQNVHINQLTHAGLEIFTGNALSSRNYSLRAGLNEKRTSFGIYIPLPHFSIEAAAYDAALFTGGKAGKERRYLIGLSSDW